MLAGRVADLWNCRSRALAILPRLENMAADRQELPGKQAMAVAGQLSGRGTTAWRSVVARWPAFNTVVRASLARNSVMGELLGQGRPGQQCPRRTPWSGPTMASNSFMGVERGQGRPGYSAMGVQRGQGRPGQQQWQGRTQWSGPTRPATVAGAYNVVRTDLGRRQCHGLTLWSGPTMASNSVMGVQRGRGRAGQHKCHGRH